MKKSVLLINPGQENQEKNKFHLVPHKIHRDSPPVSILYVGGYLSSHGYDVIILDTHIEQDYKEIISSIIAKNNVLFVGVTVLIGDYLKNAIEISRFIKEINNSIPIVWGGVFPSGLPLPVLSESFVDIVVMHEGEETALELCQALESDSSLKDVKGIFFKKDGRTICNLPRMPQFIPARGAFTLALIVIIRLKICHKI
jgi:radical SAM superfamily enzyme YgiQ (UPF0313 family)